MSLDPQQEQALLQQGFAALQQGRAGEARARLEQLTRAGSVNPLAWLLLAIALRTLRDPASEEAAVDRLLQLDPHSLRGLIMKADCRAAAGDQGSARQFYRTAIAFAEITGIPPDAAAEVEHAHAALSKLEEVFHAKRERLMTERGFPKDSWSPRFAPRSSSPRASAGNIISGQRSSPIRSFHRSNISTRANSTGPRRSRRKPRRSARSWSSS